MDSVVPWRVRTFGGFSVERNGVRHDRFRPQHAAALLAYLALRPDVRHSREVLAEHLWPDADPLLARQRLSTALANLRRELEANGPPLFTGGRDSVGVHPEMLTSDAAEFNRLIRQSKGASRDRRRELLREALEMGGKGEFLPGFYFEWAVDQSSRFEETLDAVRAEIESEAEIPSPPAEDPSSLIGRAAEIESLDRLLLARHRCISILGAGGVGKTRLALDLFERHARRFPGTTVFVRLADVRGPADFLPALARALHISSIDEIAGALAVPGLVVLDNLEHLLPDIHPQLDRLVRSCGNCTFVFTSRRRPDLAGEQVLRIRPLRLAPLSADAPAIRLFVNRYQEAGGAPLPPESLAAVDEICRALGGLPLAIQLAASASVAVGVEALREEAMLYRLLPPRHPDATNIHASLGEMIEWSLTLVDAATREVLGRLCMLPGSFNFRMVRALYGEEAAAVLPKLHADSLLEADGQGTMRVLEPIRDHLLAQTPPSLRSELEIGLVRRCAALGSELEARLEGPDQRSATEEVASVWMTMRLAIQLAERHGLPNEGLEIVISLSRAFIVQFLVTEAVAQAESLLTMPGIEPGTRARAHAMLTRFMRNLGRIEEGSRHGAAAVSLAQELGDRLTEARCTGILAYIACIQEDQAEAIRLAERALQMGRQIGDTESQTMAQLVTGHAHALFQKDASEEETRRAHAATEAHMEAAVALSREARDEFMEAMVEYHRSLYAETNLELYCARLGRAVEIHRRNGWKLLEGMARAAVVRKLYTSGQGSDTLEELHSLQAVYAECRQWVARAEQVATEAEILFRMDRYEEALTAIEEAQRVLHLHGRPLVVEYHVQALIFAALGQAELDGSLRALIDLADENEFSGMIAELARALLEVWRGEDEAGYLRLREFRPESKPPRIRHAFADSWVALGDRVAGRNRAMAVTAYRASRIVYRELKSAVDLRRVRRRVQRLDASDEVV